MTNESRAERHYTLWGGPLSLYSGKARAYLIKKRIPYREIFPSHPDFPARIMPAVGLFVIPVLEAPDGTIVQDTTDIFEYLEARHPEPRVTPSSPLQNAVAWLVSAFGSEGLLQAAMHYRWSYRKEQESFLKAEFARILSAAAGPAAREAQAFAVMGQMNGYLPILGVTPESVPAIEASFEALLGILDRHFAQHPYVLGGRPSIADFGLMAPLFAHLSRDPYPSHLMKLTAPNVCRWTERMNLPQIGDGEFWDYAEEFPTGDDIPETLLPLLQHIFRDWGPELLAYEQHYNAWVHANPSLPAGHLVSASQERRVHPALGRVTYELRGRELRRQCAPQALWHFEKAAALGRALSGTSAGRWADLLHRTGGEQVMALALARPLERRKNVLVLA
ncbi:MAG: glutathione S-transferase family protein [Gammaproteobacteria bacterium]|nr:glutathione S-transferase family protein [Gammaproteobacteria bacterium]